MSTGSHLHHLNNIQAKQWDAVCYSYGQNNESNSFHHKPLILGVNPTISEVMRVHSSMAFSNAGIVSAQSPLQLI